MIARSRSQTASTIAGFRARSAECSSTVETSTIESLMMMPVIPISPTTENIDSGTSHHQWPQTAPMRPKGITAMITAGRVQDEKIQASTR